jgi:hypothetical protein
MPKCHLILGKFIFHFTNCLTAQPNRKKVISLTMEISHDLTPAVDPSILLPNLIRYCLPKGLQRVLLSRRRSRPPVVRLAEFAPTKLHLTLMKMDIARDFDSDHSAVNRALQRGYEDRPER